MSRLNKLIDEELEKTKPNNAVILRGIDGSEIPEDNVQIDIIQLKSENLDHVQNNVEANTTLVETITDLTELLKKMRVEGENEENVKIVVDAVNNLTGLSKDYDISMEAYADPARYVSRGISTEGFLDVVKAIFIRIRDIIVGFFKAIWSFLKSLFTFEEKSEKITKENKTRLQNILSKDLTLDAKDSKPIKTTLPSIVGSDNVQTSDPAPVMADVITVSTNYRKLINDKILKSLDILEDSVKDIENIVKEIHKEEFNVSDVRNVSAQYSDLINRLLNIRTEVLTHQVVPGSMPSVASDEINDKLAKYKSGGISYCSLVDPHPGSSDRLANNYNVFAGFSSKMIETKDISKLSSDDIAFAFAVMEQSNKSTDIATTYLDPILDPKLIEMIYNTITKDRDETKFDQALSKAETVSNRITKITEWMAEKGYKDLTEIGNFVDSGCRDINERINEMFKSVTEEDWETKLGNKLGFYGKTKDYSGRNKDLVALLANSEIKKLTAFPVKIETLESLATTPFDKEDREFLEDYLIYLGYGHDLKDAPPAINFKEAAEYQELVIKMDTIFKYGVNQLSTLIKDLVISSKKTHVMFFDVTQKYINETMSQYR